MTKFLVYASLIFAFCIMSVSCLAERQENTSDTNSNSTKEKSESEKKLIEKQLESSSKNNETTETERQKSTDVKKNAPDDSLKLKKPDSFETRCGWYSNPTPGNHWITDSDGEWIIGVQGGRQAEGDYPPEFTNGQWMATNGYYGYGCACLSVKVDKKEMLILEIADGKARPLSACQNDPALKAPKE